MPELNTLKEIRLLYECPEGDSAYVNDKDNNRGSCIREAKYKLRQEAIKWYKQLGQWGIEEETDSKNSYILAGGMKFIKDFFNITEEELK